MNVRFCQKKKKMSNQFHMLDLTKKVENVKEIHNNWIKIVVIALD